MAHTYRSRKEKGRRTEVEVAKRLHEVLDVDARRMPLSGGGTIKGDIYCPALPVSFECKAQEKLNFWESFQQAREQAGLGKMPILVADRNYEKDKLAVLRFEDLLTLMDFAIQGGWVSYIPKV